MMKTRIIIILLLLGLFSVFQFYLAIFQTNAIRPSYKVLRVENEFEIRSYAQLPGSEEKLGSKLVAVLKFGGYASPRLIKFYGDKLSTALSQNEIISSDDFLCLQYNSPYQIVGRKNEIVVKISNAKYTHAPSEAYQMFSPLFYSLSAPKNQWKQITKSFL